VSLDQKSFMDLSLQGEALPDQIDDFVDIWHEGGTGLKLSEFLGFTDDEYSLWVEKPNFLKYILGARKNDKSISDYHDRSSILQLADPDGCVEDIEELIVWFKRMGQVVD